MSRINYLPRTGMYEAAFYHIIQKDSSFPYKEEDYERIEKTRKYDPRKGTTSPEFEVLCSYINEWLNEHYDMFELDYTNFDDDGSRDEVILCYTKIDKIDRPFGHPNFEKELPKIVFYR